MNGRTQREQYRHILTCKGTTIPCTFEIGAALVFYHGLTRPNPAGFTLLELLVVLVILGLLAGYVAPKYFSQIGKSEAKVAKAQVEAFDKALGQYRIDVGRYPTSEEGLAALNTKPANEPKWAGPYLSKQVPLDPWGKPYIYRYPGQHGEYDLYSLGKDGAPGGTGEAADITSWQ